VPSFGQGSASDKDKGSDKGSALGSTSNPMCVKTMNRVRKRESLFESAANNPEQKTRLHREIEATDRQIDQLVYELY